MNHQPEQRRAPQCFAHTVRGPITIGDRVRISPAIVARLDCNPAARARLEQLRGYARGFKLNTHGMFVRVLWENADEDHRGAYGFITYSSLVLA
jgi:hypothetical protein